MTAARLDWIPVALAWALAAALLIAALVVLA